MATPLETVYDWTTVYAYTNSDPLCKCTPVYTGQLWESKGMLSFVAPKGDVTQWHGEVDYESNGHVLLSFSFTGDEKNMKTPRLLQVNDDGAYEGWDYLGKFVELKTLAKYEKAKNVGYWNRR